MSLPTFFIIGAEKCGTTALHSILAQHPQIFMSTPKEPSFFVSSDPRYLRQKMGEAKLEYVGNAAAYREIFATAGHQRARGEASPCYLYSDVAPAKIRELVPDARIIAILRKPTERAYSQFIYNQQQGWEPRARTFREALDMEPGRIEANDMWAFHYVARSLYYPQLKRYFDIFGQERVKVWLYDDLNDRPEIVLPQIHEFLGVSPQKPTRKPPRIHVSGLPRFHVLHALTEQPNPIKTVTKRLLPNSARRRVLAAIRSWNLLKPKPDEQLLRDLEGVFRNDIERLEELIGPGPKRWLT